MAYVGAIVIISGEVTLKKGIISDPLECSEGLLTPLANVKCLTLPPVLYIEVICIVIEFIRLGIDYKRLSQVHFK